MKRHFIKSLKALCTGVMTLCVASFCFTSCYDDSALNERIEGVESQISALDEKIEAIKTQLQTLTARVDALYTLEFQVNDSNELQYSFDGGATWVSTGVTIHDKCTCVVPDPCTCKEVSLVDNGESVTITVGDQSFTIEKPKEVVFEIRAGKVYFESEGTQSIAIKSSGIDDITVISYPKGWYAEIASDGKVEVTAPDFQSTVSDGYWNEDWTEYTEVPATAAAEGYVKVHACSVDGKCMVGKLPVVVSAQPVNVKAYGGMAYFNAAGNWPALFYYGASPKESFEAEVASLLEQLNSKGWADWNANGDGYDNYATVEASIEDLLGSKVEQGKEYVVYAIIEDYNKTSYSMEDFIVVYYSEINVTAVEDESLRTPYNVTATVEVMGADSYYAYAVPGNYASTEEDLLNYKEMFVNSFGPDSWGAPLGKYFTESYTGSVLDIAYGTTSSMSGNYAPDRKIFLLVLPMDGRPTDEYTIEDIWQFDFQTASLTAGGSIDAVAAPVDTYYEEVFDWSSYEYILVEKTRDIYSQVAVEVSAPSSADWVEFYYKWLDDATWGLYGSDDEFLVDYLLKNTNGIIPSDISFPYYAVEAAEPQSTMHFVAMFVDKSGKYGKLAKVDMTTEAVEWSDIAWKEPVATNLVNEVLKNTDSFEITPSTDMTASKYKYVWTETGYYNPFEGKDDAAMASAIHLNQTTGYECVTVTADELVDGKIVVSGHYYGSNYYLAVLPYDEAGNPGKSAQIFEYSCAFELESISTNGAEFDATKPQYTINLPAVMDENADGAIYYYSYVDYYKKYQFSYELNVEITPVEGTTVRATFVTNGNYYTLTGDAVQDASALWQGSIESWANYKNITEAFTSSNRLLSHYDDTAAPDVWFIISWYDADGNYYYEAQSLQAELQKLADNLYYYAYTPAGKQYSFPWTAMGLDNARLDVGVSIDGYSMIGYDLGAMYPDDPGAAGIWMAYLEGYFEIEKTDNTSGKIWYMTADYVTGDLTRGTALEYSNLTYDSVTLNCADFAIENVTATRCEDTVTIQSQGIAMGNM